MCALHLFAGLMRSITHHAAMKSIESCGGQTSLHDHGLLDSGHYSLKLQNSFLDELANFVQQTDLCTEQEAHLTIISALMLKGKMPKADAVIE